MARQRRNNPGPQRPRAGPWSSIENIPPALVAAISMLAGVLLLVGSVAAHANKAVFSGMDKTLGYFYEVNWSVNYVVAIPVALYFCASGLNTIRSVIGNISRAGMIVGPDGAGRDCAYLLEDWHKVLKRFVYVGIVLALVAIGISWREWFQDFSYDPHLDSAAVMKLTGLLPGWNLAPTVNGTQFFRAARVFGFLAFTMQGLVASCYILFICVIYAFATWIYRFTLDSTQDELVPDTSSPDPRMGFERFEPLIETLLSLAIAFFVVFYLTRLDNAYVPADAHGFGEFVRTDLWYGFINGIGGLFKGKGDLFYPGKDLTNAIVIVGAGLGIAVVTGFLFPAVIVRQAAMSSRDRMTTPPKGMIFWPLRYPKPVQLILLITLASACFVFYRLTLVIVGAMIALGVKEFYRVLKGSN
jgi:hypothetical protein